MISIKQRTAYTASHDTVGRNMYVGEAGRPHNAGIIEHKRNTKMGEKSNSKIAKH
jgi:hypothetical protein